MTHSEMTEKRGAVLANAKQLAEKAETENRNLTVEEKERYNSLVTEANDLKERAERLETVNRELRAIPEIKGEDPNIGLTDKELRSYSWVRAIRAAASGDWSKAGFEKETSAAVAQKLGSEPRGFYVPNDVLEARGDLTKGTGSGDQIVATNLLAASYIDLLRNRLVTKAAGATMLTGLVGDVAIPKASVGATAYWVAEDGAATESSTAYTQVTLTPRGVSAYQDVSRLLLKQSSPDVEMLIKNDIAKTLAIAIDAAALHGRGATTYYEPTGVAATSGIGSVAGGTNGAAPDWADIIDLETEVSVDNADVGALAYITNPKVRGKLKQTAKVSSTDSIMVWSDGLYPLNGYPCYVTNQVSSVLTKGTATEVCSAIFYGNWNDLLIGMWGGLDLIVDPYSLSTTGQLRLVAFSYCDVAVRHAQSFSAMLDATTA